LNVITPDFVGQVYVQADGTIWQAGTLLANSWTVICAPSSGIVINGTQLSSFVMIGALGGTPDTSISFPDVTQTTVGGLVLNNNASLASLSVPNLQDVATEINIIGTAITTLSLPALASYPGTAINGGVTLQVLDIPLVGNEGTLINDLGSLGGLTTLNINSIPSFAADFDLSSQTSLTSLNISSLATVGGNLNLNGTAALPTFSAPALTTISGNASAVNALVLATFSAPLWVVTDGTQIIFTGDALTEASVDHILARCLASGVTTCNIDLSGGTNAVPGAQGQLDKAALILAGNIVTTN
jgi:hypothetical protein